MQKVLKIAKWMKSSSPLLSNFDTWQERKGYTPLKFVVPSPTRWGGYLQALLRWAAISQRFWQFVNEDTRLYREDRDRLRSLRLTQPEEQTVAAIAYVLHAPHQYDLASQEAS